MRHGSAIDRDDQLATLAAQPDERLARRPIPFEQAIGDIGLALDTQAAQQAQEQRGTGRPVDVVIAIDRDALARDDRIGKPACGKVHVTEDRGIGQEIAQRGPTMAFEIVVRNPA